MRKPTKRETILIGVLVLAGLWTLSLDRGLERKRRANRAARARSRAAVAQLAAQGAGRGAPRAAHPGRGARASVAWQASSSRRPAAGARAMQSALPSGWGLDPFDRPFAARTSPVEEPSLPGVDESIRLEGVLITERGAAAMIGGELYREGDRVGPLEIVSIRRDAVVVRHPGDGTTTTLEVK